MDYSLRSLQRNSGSQTEQNKARREENRNDKQGEIMRNISEVCKDKDGNRIPVNINDIIKTLAKRNIEIEKPQLKEIVKYYQNLNVVYMNEDQEVMFI